MTDARKRLYVKTYGCQMNVYDSERMRDVLAPSGYQAVDAPDDADLIILNTCHIREKAAEKVYSEIGRLKHLKDRGATIAVAGCVAQAEGAEILARAPAVDFVLGPQSTHKLPELVAKAGSGQVAADFDVAEKFEALKGARAVSAPTAFVTVQEGCDKFCTFCVVPYTRGAEWSRPVAQIVAEVEGLVERGVREITLLGQNVNAYSGEDGEGRAGLADLIDRLAAIEDLARIRFTTSHPRDMDDALIAAFAAQPKLMPYLHLPVQAGSDRILKAMNRGHTGAEYLSIIERLRAARADVALSGDFIVGFPGETEADFQDTLGLARAARYAQAYSFKYSPRPGTPAAERDDQVPDDEKADRLARLQAVLERQQTEFNLAQIGKRLAVLFERPGRKAGQLGGRSPYLQAVHVDGPTSLIGGIGAVEIEAAGRNSLTGRLVAPVTEAA